MASDTIRKAIADAVLAVQDVAMVNGTKAAMRRDWKAEANSLAPASVSVGERPLYRETFWIAAEHAAALLASFN